MISSRVVALILLAVGWAIFMTPQDLLRRWVKTWSRGYSFVFWLTKVAALIMIVLGVSGLILGK